MSDAAREPDEADDDPMIGVVLAGRYRIEARLGRGGMGTVYRARHLSLDRPVAVKLLHPRLTADPEVARRFDREALAASKLDHPNIVRVIDAGAADDGARFIVMELLQGRELRAMGDAPFAPARAVAIAVQVLRGLEHAHRRGFVHRDLKPENVFVVQDDDEREIAKLVDFGIVKLLANEEGDDKLTRAGLVFGTPKYMSPEQAAGGKVDERADLYAVGVVLYEMLAGTPPFDADEAGLLIRMHLVADPPALPEGIPAAVRTVVARLLEKSPKDRYASAREVREALETAAHALSDVPAASAGASFGDAATAAHAATPLPPPPPPPVTTPPPAASAPVLLVPPSGVYRTVVTTPPPMPAPRSRASNAIVALVLVVTATAVIAYATLGIRDCTADPAPAAVGAPASTLPAAPPPASAPESEPAGAETTAAEESKEDWIPPGQRKKKKKKKKDDKKHDDDD